MAARRLDFAPTPALCFGWSPNRLAGFFGSSPNPFRLRRAGWKRRKDGVVRPPWRGINGWATFIWTPRGDPNLRSACARGAWCASTRIWSPTSVQNLESWIQRSRKIGARKFLRGGLVFGSFAVLLLSGSVCWAVCAKPLLGHQQSTWTTARMWARSRSRARSAASMRQNFGHQARKFIDTSGWVNLLSSMALRMVCRSKSNSSRAKQMKVAWDRSWWKKLAQSDFRS